MGKSSTVSVEALAPKTGTRLTISAVPTSGYVPFDVVVSGILYDVFATPLIGKTVNLYISGTYYAARTTGGDGKYSFTVTLSTAGTYLFYTEFPGDAVYEGCSIHDGTQGLEEGAPPPDWGKVLLVSGLLAFVYFAVKEKPFKTSK